MSEKQITDNNKSAPNAIAVAGLLGICIIFVAVVFAMIFGGSDYHEDQCTDLCISLDERKIKYTEFGCVCENKDGERVVHQNRVTGQ